MTQGVKDLINAIAEGDASSIDAAFNAEMATRISSRLEDLRVQVAQGMFQNPVAEEVAEETAEDQEEVTEDAVEESVEQSEQTEENNAE
jgi:HAMP domain-containing protein